MQLQRNTSDGRRTNELNKQQGIFKRFTSMPSIGQLLDGQSGYIVGQGILVFRDGNKVWQVQATEI